MKTTTALVVAGAVGVAILLYEMKQTAAAPTAPRPSVPTVPHNNGAGAAGLTAGADLVTGNYLGAASISWKEVGNKTTVNAAQAAAGSLLHTTTSVAGHIGTTAKKTLDTITFGVL